MKRDSAYFKWGLTVVCTVSAILLFYDTLFGSKVLQKIGGQLFMAVLPVLYGGFIAYLLAPMVNFFEEQFFSDHVRKAREKGRLSSTGIRAVSLLLTWAVICVLLYLLASVLLLMNAL